MPFHPVSEVAVPPLTLPSQPGAESDSTHPRTLDRSLRRPLLLALLIATILAPSARADDAASGFSSNNLAGSRWTYGWTLTRGSAFTLYNTYGTTADGLNNWSTTGTRGGVFYKPAPGTARGIPYLTMALFSGSPTTYAVVRYTAQFSGTFAVRATFNVRTVNAITDVAVLQGSQTLFAQWLSPPVTSTMASMSTVIALTAGQTLDFVVGPADEASEYVGLDATVNALPPPVGQAGPVFVFGGERFVPCRWPGKAVESIAFDPVNRRLASEADITNLCGVRVSAGPDEAPGLAWDPRSLTYWRLTNNRVVERWTAAGALLDTAFAIPLTFTVPGSGLDTLDSPRGIAVDSNFVYVVDAGANPGQITSNAWFKFTRTGAPVKSSRTTNLLANLDADPDALVDDIVYVPFSSPFMPGRLLVALEHSGIQVLDTEGNFVDKFRWSTQGLTPVSAIALDGKLSAFAGLTIDPATGNLYLADNDTGHAQIWTRIGGSGPAFYAVGVVGNGVSGVLQYPNPGCNLPLWGSITPGSPSNLFGAAYRDADHSIYTCDYNPGELWKFDARSGRGTRIGDTGLQNVWGIAYDSQRNVLYFAFETSSGRRLVTVDPVSGAAAPLPQAYPYLTLDLAFNSADQSVYGIEGGAPSRLIRINRDTGAGTVVGNTVSGRGIDYDPASGKLITFDQTRLYRITPATGAFDTLAVLPNATGWEGLAVVPLPANPFVSVGDRPPSREPMALLAWPNPARASSSIAFELPAAADGAVRVYDVTGRAVRELQRGRLAAGRHSLTWDGNDGDGRPLASGVYFVRLETGQHTQVARLTRVR